MTRELLPCAHVLGDCVAVLCLTSYLEPFGCVAVEAQLCGTPVISTDFGGMVETVEQFKTFLYFSLIILLLSGSVLIIGEPARSLANEAFQIKMVFLITALVCNFYLFKQLKNSQKISRVLCIFAIAMWLGVVFSGRWIAYV